MAKVTICLELPVASIYVGEEASFEEQYQQGFKKVLSFLYTHHRFPLSIPFSGEQLVYFQDRHPEALEILKELTNRHQIEVLGVGYYAPIFPLLFPVDRIGQIEKLNAELRSTIGKRPRGMMLFGSIWDSSLVTTFQSCDMEYVHIDSTLVPSTAKGFYPLITSEQGKSVKILPLYANLSPSLEEDGRHWFERVKHAMRRELRNEENSDFPLVLTIPLDPLSYGDFFQSPVCESINALLESARLDAEEELSFSLPQAYLRTAKRFIPAYIPAGMDWQIGQWARTAYKKCENKSRFPITIHDYLNTYRQSKRLYERMVYIRMRLGQSGGDKVRKKAAQEKLWEAQGGLHFLSPQDGLPAQAALRQKAYRALNEAEKLVRESSDFKESFTKFDYNGDGLCEYVCRMQTFHAVIQDYTGQIIELDLINGGPDYVANTDSKRTLFSEQLYERGHSEAGLSPIFFNERKFDARRQEIQLEGQGCFAAAKQALSLRKNYIVTTNGFVLQYILKNESQTRLDAVFEVEANFAQTVFDTEKQYEPELILNGGRKTLSDALPYSVDSGVSMLQILDRADKISFRFEPNEAAGFKADTLCFADGSHALSIRFFWTVSLEADRAMEKTINFAIVPIRKLHSL